MTQQSILKEDTLLKIGGVGLIVGAILMVISTIWPASVDLSGAVVMQKNLVNRPLFFKPAHCS